MKNKIIDDLRKVDKYLGSIDETITVSIVGGAAFIMKGWIDRPTRDIDSISLIDRALSKQIKEAIDIDINSGPNSRLIIKFFKGWEDNLIKSDLEFDNIVLYELSDVSLLASKFFTRQTDRDLTNAAYTGQIVISQEELEDKILDIWEDLRASIERVRLWDRQMEIIEFYRGMGWKYEDSKIRKLFER